MFYIPWVGTLFGMPAENAARENNLHPKEWTEKNISTMKSQLKKLGLSIDWEREISTCSEDYYKHQQLFFIELYNKGLVYRKEKLCKLGSRRRNSFSK